MRKTYTITKKEHNKSKERIHNYIWQVSKRKNNYQSGN